MNTTELWTVVVQAIAAFGTLVLAALAIWGEWFRSIFAAPKMIITLREGSGELTTFGDGRPVRYYHLLVSNSRRWAPCRNVVAYLTRVERPSTDGSWQQALRTGPVVLPWQFGKFHRGLPTIGRDWICDLARISEADGLELVTEFRPNNLDTSLRTAGRLQAHVVAIGDNGESEPCVVEFDWDGAWKVDASEMAKHLVVRQV